MTNKAEFGGIAETLERVERDNQKAYAIPDACFLRPTPGRVIVAQDAPKAPSKIILAPQKSLVRPTTGRVVATGIGTEDWMGKRVLYGMMSGIAVQFKNRPAWIALAQEEIVAEIAAEDAEIDQDTPLPLDGSYA
jgi:co-chaperonin GroES (HSP10)